MHKTQVCLISGYARDDSPKTKSDKPKVCIFYLSFLAEKSNLLTSNLVLYESNCFAVGWRWRHNTFCRDDEEKAAPG